MVKIAIRSKLVLLCMLYKILLEIGYSQGIAIFLFYSGIEINFSIVKFIMSWIMFFFISYVSFYRIELNYLGIINIFFLFFSYIPTIGLWGIKAGITWGGIVAISFFLICMLCACWFVQNIMSKYLKRNNINKLYDQGDSYYFTILMLSIFSFVFMVIFHQFFIPNRWSLSLMNSLSARLESRNIIIPLIPRYVYMILAGSIIPILFVYSLATKKKIFIVLNFLSSYIAFTYNGMKTYLLLYVVVIGIYILAKNCDSLIKLEYRMFQGIVSLWLFGIIFWKSFGNNFILAYLHRTFTLPAEMHYYYYDFFSKNELLYLRDSVGRFFASSPYIPSASRTIGKIYYMSQTNNATNGMFSDFFANFGYVGLMIYPLAIFGTIGFLGINLKQHTDFTILSISFILIIVLIGNTFFTWLLTGGYFFTIALIFITRKLKTKWRT